jgi:hypothetical protein
VTPVKLNITGEGDSPMPATEAPARGSAGHVQQLHQLLAVRDGARSIAERAVTKAYHTIQRAEPLSGIQRTHERRFEDDAELPGEYKHVQVLAPTVVAEFSRALARLFDVTAAVDYTNQAATADVVVDGNILVHEAPAPFLIFLEKKLVDVRTFIEKLPVLDPAIEWNDPVAPGQPYRSRDVRTTSTKKVLRNHVKAEATDKHAAQVELYQEDVVSGWWTTVKLSGALPAAEVAAMRERVDKLIEAVKVARGEANMQPVEDPKPGAALLAYVFGQ